MGINLNKRISLVKETLEKKSFDGNVEVAMVLDVSGSMSSMFNNGTVQDLVERLLAIGINLDGDKKIESYIFSNSYKKLEDITVSNYEGYANREIYKKGLVNGGTNYAPVIKALSEDYLGKTQKKGLFSRFKKESEPQLESKNPLVVFFVTDGDNFDKSETKNIIKSLSGENIFFQFIGISEHKTSNFPFLEKLDDLDGRVRDNANFFNSGKVSEIDDSKLFEGVLEEMPSWYKRERNN